MSKQSLKDVYQNEIHPDLYLERQKAIRRRMIGEVIGCVFIAALALGLFALVEIAYGIW